MATINRQKLEKVLEQEIQLFAREHPKCYALYQRAKDSLLDGVPMNWMVRWAGGYPLFVDHAKGAHFTCADGKQFLDFCLGDTGAMVGHSPDGPVAEIKQQLDKGITFMLPT
jgi:glutamate-1-semialdehyde 2,1-aminomutase